MHYKFLGKTGIQVSALSFGTMTFGGEADEATSAALYRECRNAGINLFDCANVYHNGKSEEILGLLIKSEREKVLITSKAYFPAGKDINAQGLSRRHILQAFEASLKRLQTDYIDIYYMHHFDEHTPLEESLRAMSDLVASGKVIYLGVSNFAAWQIMKGLGLSALHSLPAFQVIQPMYNLLKRQAEVEIFPLAQLENLGVIPYNPLAGGMLSGKYLTKKAAEGTRFNENRMYQLRYQDKALEEATARFVAFAKSHGFSPVSLAIAWSASHPAVTCPMLGARTLAQLQECLKATEIHMTQELRKEISHLTAEPPPATDRSDEL